MDIIINNSHATAEIKASQTRQYFSDMLLSNGEPMENLYELQPFFLFSVNLGWLDMFSTYP